MSCDRENWNDRAPEGARRGGRRRGVITVWVAVLSIVLIGMIGLSVDTGYVMWTSEQLANAADAAALAGAQRLRDGSATAKATAASVASQNKAGGAAVTLNAATDVVLGTYATATRTFTPGGASPNAVRVTARRTAATSPVPLIFGALFGVGSVEVTRTATAVADSVAAPGLIVLDPCEQGALTLESNAHLTVNGAFIYVNSRNTCAVKTKSNAKILGSGLKVGGSACMSQNTIPVQEDAPEMPDPLGSLPKPAFPSGKNGVTVSSNSQLTITPGYYTGGIRTESNSKLTLEPGIYILGGEGLVARSNSQITSNGKGVMLYITGTGRVDISSNATVSLTAPDTARDTFAGASTYEGVAIFQDRSNSRQATLSSNSGLPIVGTLYFPSAPVEVSSNAAQSSFRLIANTLHLSSNARVTIESSVSHPAGRTYLVQ